MILVAAQDLFERWQKMDASVLTEEEVAQGAITTAPAQLPPSGGPPGL